MVLYVKGMGVRVGRCSALLFEMLRTVMRLFGNFGVGTWCFTSQMLILTLLCLGSGRSLGFLKMC